MTAEPRALSGSPVRRRRPVVASILLRALVVALLLLHLCAPAYAGQPSGGGAEGVSDLLSRLETALASGDPAQYLALVSPAADRQLAEEFARGIVRPGITRAVVRERDRGPIADADEREGLRLIAEVFLQSGMRGSVATWRLDIRREPAGAGAEGGRWAIVVQERLTAIEGLHRLVLDGTKQFRIRNLQLTGEDLTLAMSEGVAFRAEADQGATAIVLMGRGTMTFQPKPAAERGQIKLFADDETLRTPFNVAFVRVNPAELSSRMVSEALLEERVDPSALRRALEIFDEEVGKSFNLDLSDLSRETWSLVPPIGDMLVEVRTRRFGTLTYTQSGNESEDISLFDRKRRRNISAYASERKLAVRARFYSENDEVDYDVLHYDVQSHFFPERDWIEGRTVVRLRVTAYIMGTLTLRLAESLVVQAVTSPRFGRLLSLRVKGQNSVLVNLPMPLARGDELVLAVAYAGRLGTATPDREVLLAEGQDQEGQVMRNDLVIPAEPRTLYTNRSYWYPQSTVGDYATATLRLTVPDGLACVATGAPASGNPVRVEGRPGGSARRLYLFSATQPARYLAVVITRLSSSNVVTETLRLPESTATLARNAQLKSSLDAAKAAEVEPVKVAPEAAPALGAKPAALPGEQASADRGVFYETLDLTVVSHPRQSGRTRTYAQQATSILSRYAEIVGDLPYPSFTLTLVDDPLPGGHSPAYFALLHQPLPTTNYTWRNDPVSFDKFPQFFLAHELAHQYWGDAVGGENYHEQWISEGFAQFFALLYAERTRPKDTFEDILRQMRRTSIASDRYGPVWLGYRLGHLQGDSRVFRALVYNKGALVLHMLRRLLGDDAFFRGLRRFYLASRFMKVGTDDVQKAFEVEGGRSLDRFFERWIMQSGVARVSASHSVEAAGASGTGGGTLTLRFEQQGELYEYPLTVRLRYATGEYEDVIVPVTERSVTRTHPLKARLQEVQVNGDDGALVEVVR